MADTMEHLTLTQKKTVLFTVAGVLFFAAVNQTIVGTSLPKIVAALGKMEYFSWIFTAYMFTSSVAALIAGKLSDHYGRKKFFFAGILILMGASFACGLAESMQQLILFRVFQGIGGGILISLAFAAVGDLFAPRERGKWQGLLTSTFGLSSLVGPTLGGFIVDSFHWRWIFWLFLPLGFAALFILARFYPKDKAHAKDFKIDIKGSASLVLFLSTLMAGLGIHDDSSVWIFFAVAAMGFITFIFIERRAADPILPLKLFRKNNFAISNLSGFLLGMAMFGVVIYVPFFLQGVMNISGFLSGTMMMAMTVSLVAASAGSGRMISFTGHYKMIGIGGIFLMVAGMGWMSRLTADSSHLSTYLRLILFGVGLGVSFTVSTFAVQLDVGRKNSGLAVSASQLFRQIGGTIGVSIFGGVFTQLLTSKMSAIVVAPDFVAAQHLLQNPRILLDQTALKILGQDLSAANAVTFSHIESLARMHLGEALTALFLVGCCLLLTALIAMLFLREYPLGDRENTEELTEREAT